MGRPSKHPEEFRNEAVELARMSGLPVVDVAALAVDPRCVVGD
jgi:hypothetical protein